LKESDELSRGSKGKEKKTQAGNPKSKAIAVSKVDIERRVEAGYWP